MSGDRDQQLGDAINDLPVPPRDDQFMVDLERRLEVADAERAPAGTVVPAHPLRGWLARGRRKWLLVAAAAAAIVLGVALFGPGRGADRSGVGPESATAAQIIRSSLAATGGGRSLRGVVLSGVVRNGRFQLDVREKFVMSDDGSIAVLGRGTRNGEGGPIADSLPGSTYRAAYDASARVETHIWHFAKLQHAQVDRNGKVRHFTFSDQAVIRRRLAAGPPDSAPGSPASSPLDEVLPLARLRANMRQLVADGSASSATVRDVVVDGRPAWLISTTQLAPGNAPVPPSTPVTLVIDKATRLPVVYRWTMWVDSRPHRVVLELRFEDLVVGGEVKSDTFTLRVPAHALVTPDFGRHAYRAIDYRDARLLGTTIGCANPAFPAWVPQGFRLSASSTYAAGDTSKPAGGEWQPEPDSASVSLAYRRGFDVVYVCPASRTPGAGRSRREGRRTEGHFDDPLMQWYRPGWRYLESRTHDVRLTSGPFAGETAHIVVDPSVLPHLWVTNGGNTVTVSGDLSPTDMVRVAESLRRGEQLAAASPRCRRRSGGGSSGRNPCKSLVGARGFEPRTSSLSEKRSNRLSYAPTGAMESRGRRQAVNRPPSRPNAAATPVHPSHRCEAPRA